MPDWPAPTNVSALVTTRCGGVSKPPFDTLNLGFNVGDESSQVEINRLLLEQHIDTSRPIQWLEQVHGIEVIEASSDADSVQADAAVTSHTGLPCAVMTADCLPVFFCTLQGDRVAVAHAGWRGLATGVLESTLKHMNVNPGQIMAWLGPAIGPYHFEVGPEVRSLFVGHSESAVFAFRESTERPGYWLTDLYELARLRLTTRGVQRIYGGSFCTYAEGERFYSYRRDQVTGRMASVIWLNSPA